LTRDSFSEPVSEYSATGGPRRAALPDPPTIEMPEPGRVPEYRATSDPPLGQSAEEAARRGERYWMQASGLPEVERTRRANVERQRYYDAVWAKRHPFAPYGAPARDETGRLMEQLCPLEDDDGMGNLSGATEGGDYYEIRKTPTGYNLARERKEAAPALAPISDRRAVSSRDREGAALREIQRKNDALWARPFRQRP
jgi:hypothetical protein